MLNLAEGAGKHSKPDKRRLLDGARFGNGKRAIKLAKRGWFASSLC
ncbi:MAG: hypothetical protein M3020_02975 [Myxococcota bacterium]|nr:hypothetical protein [Myxococcota bacterium]